ncbi:unnamed protein product [Trichogramma brassicae]|uniref:Uncharacterized protein n=1 Tax=Trichogramma brassicae TaxID=86971 RepID=A0A6H5ID50_9HYME|nr:unnamed protein product [Trichogramma brassicae]
MIPRDDNMDYYMKYALKHRSLKIVKLLAANNVNIHEFFFDDGTSALHYLAESSEGDYNFLGETMELIRFIVNESQKNLSDEYGYTYFHGACMAGDEETVRRLISQGVDVDLDTWKDSPLHIAAQYRRKEIVKILLENGASPNRLDRERSTPLHALARQRVGDFVECYTGYIDSIEKRSVDAIVDLLVAKGANIEARNKDENTPLSLAVSRLDVDVTRSLLKHGASLDSIKEHNIFSCNFEPLQLKNYPWTWKIIEVMQLLQSAGYEMSLLARYRMLKCWLKVRGINDTEHLIPHFTSILYTEQRPLLDIHTRGARSRSRSSGSSIAALYIHKVALIVIVVSACSSLSRCYTNASVHAGLYNTRDSPEALCAGMCQQHCVTIC